MHSFGSDGCLSLIMAWNYALSWTVSCMTNLPDLQPWYCLSSRLQRTNLMRQTAMFHNPQHKSMLAHITNPSSVLSSMNSSWRDAQEGLEAVPAINNAVIAPYTSSVPKSYICGWNKLKCIYSFRTLKSQEEIFKAGRHVTIELQWNVNNFEEIQIIVYPFLWKHQFAFWMV